MHRNILLCPVLESVPDSVFVHLNASIERVPIHTTGNAFRTQEGRAKSLVTTLLSEPQSESFTVLAWEGAEEVAILIVMELLGRNQAVRSIIFLGPEFCLDTNLVDLPKGMAVRHLPLSLNSVSKSPSSLDWIANVLRDERNFAYTTGGQPSVITIQAGAQNSQTVFCVPGAGDSVTSFIPFSNSVGANWRIIGLQPRGLDNCSVPHTTVEASAESYIRAANLSQQPTRFHLVGHSFGGWVAYEMACILQANGVSVKSLTLIDSEVPQSSGRNMKEATRSEVLACYIEMLELASERPLPIDKGKLAESSKADQLRLIHEAMVKAQMLSRRSQPESLRCALETFASNFRSGYAPARRYAGSVGVVLVDDKRLDRFTNDLNIAAAFQGWSQFADIMISYKGRGNHMTVLKAPNIAELAHWWLSHEAPVTY